MIVRQNIWSKVNQSPTKCFALTRKGLTLVKETAEASIFYLYDFFNDILIKKVFHFQA
jgi:hypothetical protein